MNSTERPLRVVFSDIANTGWTAGAHYYQNLFAALRSLDAARRPHLALIRPAYAAPGGYDGYWASVDEVLTAPGEPGPPTPNFAQRQARRVRNWLGQAEAARSPAPNLSLFLKQRQFDLLFACWTDYGPSFSVPWLGWIPDFQHVHLPELFPADELRYRDWLFGAMAANAARVILSSEDARRDFSRFSPAAAGKARVLRFTVQLPPEVHSTDPGWIAEHYHLPERFIYLPDQFWRHKNHELVVQALSLLKPDCPDVTVVCTGNPNDNRASLYFGELLATVARLGLRENFVVLGWVPHAHIFHLMRQAVAVLQPSRFEGWSTTVEETKSLGKTIILSDIAVHREQAPANASYFDPHDATALAECMLQAFMGRAPGPDEALETAARAELPGRVRSFAETFVSIGREIAA